MADTNDDEGLPRFSYDLISMLDETTARLQFPATATGWSHLSPTALQQAAFTCGARALVDQLLAMREEEEDRDKDPDVDDAADGPGLRFPRLLGPDGEVREVAPFVRLASLPSG